MNKCISLKIQQFFYKTIHDTHKIGRYWLKIDGFETRAICKTCGDDETMDHILTECTHPSTQLIWSLARKTWPHGSETWPQLTLGTIVGCGTIEIRTATNQRHRHTTNPGPQVNAGATRLIKILLSESAYLIWTTRCERIIRGIEPSERAMKATWRNAINRRFSEDVITAMKVLRRQNHTKLIKHTWEKALLQHHGNLPENWLLRVKGF